jgi:pentapeptide repeat protein
MRWLQFILFITLALSIVGCGNRDQELRKVANLQLLLSAHKDWLAAGGCKPSGDGSIDREDPAVVATSIGKLEPISLFRTNLRGADLSNRDLRCMSFIGADLTGATFFGADVRGAFFNRATLVGANLERADMRGAIFYNADVDRMVYQPKHAPAPSSLALARNLNRITYDDDPTLLYGVKNALKERGYVDAHKSVIAALRRSHPPEDSQETIAHRSKSAAGSAIQSVLFDWTCEFGSNAFRPLVVILLLWIICGAIYAAALLRNSSAGLFLISTGERIPKGKRAPHVLRVHARKAYIVPRLLSAMSTGLFFSFRRTFHFGFKELDFGNWLKLLQAREFDIRAYGWPRVISGAQSILSIYLLALAIVSAFTTPFDL